MGKNNNSIRYLFLTLKLSEIKDSGKQGFTTTSPFKEEMSFAGIIIFFILLDFFGFLFAFQILSFLFAFSKFFPFYLLFLIFSIHTLGLCLMA